MLKHVHAVIFFYTFSRSSLSGVCAATRDEDQADFGGGFYFEEVVCFETTGRLISGF